MAVNVAEGAVPPKPVWVHAQSNVHRHTLRERDPKPRHHMAHQSPCPPSPPSPLPPCHCRSFFVCVCLSCVSSMVWRSSLRWMTRVEPRMTGIGGVYTFLFLPFVSMSCSSSVPGPQIGTPGTVRRSLLLRLTFLLLYCPTLSPLLLLLPASPPPLPLPCFCLSSSSGSRTRGFRTVRCLSPVTLTRSLSFWITTRIWRSSSPSAHKCTGHTPACGLGNAM